MNLEREGKEKNLEKMLVKKSFVKKRMFFLLLGLFFCFNFVSAVNIGLSPATINFNGVVRDGYAERYVVISSDSPENVLVEVSARGEINDWVDFSSDSFNVSLDNPYYLKVFVNPPSDIPNGNYTGFVRVITSSLGEGVEGHAVGRVRSSLDLFVSTTVTDIESVSCSVSGLEIFSTEEGEDIIFRGTVQNNGNVRIKPTISVDLWDSDQISIAQSDTFFGEEVLPTTSKEYEFRINSDDLSLGQYWSDFLFLECDSSSTLTFDLLEEGALRAKVELLSIVSRPRSPKGETIPIEVNFKNTGEKEVEAYFKGKISYAGDVFQLLESEKLLVPVLDVEKFNFYFTPKKEGKYVISGRVYYSGKKTFESSMAVDVFSLGFNYKNAFLMVVYLLFMVLIGFLIYKIRNERKGYLKKLRSLK